MGQKLSDKTPEQRERRRAQLRESGRRYLANLTPEQREERRAKERQWRAANKERIAARKKRRQAGRHFRRTAPRTVAERVRAMTWRRGGAGERGEYIDACADHERWLELIDAWRVAEAAGA